MIVYMNKQILIEQLEQYGLSEIEAAIYLHLLESGPQTALELSRSINIDRSKVYRSVEKLLAKKFLEETHAAWGKKLQAAAPSNIALLVAAEEEAVKSRKEALPALIDELSTVPMYSQREFEVKHYRGQEGLKQMMWNQLSAKKEIVAFSYKTRNEIVGKNFAEKVRSEQVARKIVLYEIENETDQGDYWYTDVEKFDKFYKSRYISPKTLDIDQHISIFNDTVSIINFVDDEKIGLEIINSSFAKTQKQVFWKFWAILENGKGSIPVSSKTKN